MCVEFCKEMRSKDTKSIELPVTLAKNDYRENKKFVI
jgi:hypothetical protein